MKQKIQDLNWYQKGILLLLLALIPVYAVIYHVSISRVGVLYNDKIFVPAEESGATVYSGRLDGKPAEITVTNDKTAVTFRCGDTVYGPYTIEEDPSALADIEFCPSDMRGVALYDGETLLFRGGFWPSGEFTQLYRADGSPDLQMGLYAVENGVWKDADGNVVDPMKPDAADILRIALAPELTHKGDWLVWFGAVCISLLNAATILYADELFRWNLSFQIQNAEKAEPSEWEMLSRYLGWTVLTILAFVVYILGLK